VAPTNYIIVKIEYLVAYFGSWNRATKMFCTARVIAAHIKVDTLP
jgi:hypothetical protein